MTDHIITSREGRVLVLTMNRPDKKNALTHDMYSVLADGLDAAAEDGDIRAVVIRSSGDDFTSGNDLKEFAAGLQRDDELPVFRFLRTIATFEKPIVAAVNGLAVGIGVTMLLHCDLVYASEAATFSTPFTNLALVPEASSSYLLPKTMGTAKASEMFMLGNPITAQEAEKAGLVARILSTDGFAEKILGIAQELAQKSPNSLRQTKKLLRQNHDIMMERMAEEGVLFEACLKTPEFMEVATAFFEKRPPDFSKF